tara:strand:+ start:1461 stop:1802 length:342 start_codon:yes stop_codon:yes gene_type:complete
MKMYWSGLDDNKTLVLHVEHGDVGSTVDLLDTRGHGFAVFGPDVEVPFAVVDYRLIDTHGYTDDHMLAIEAHELGHIHTQSTDEATAERAGIALLEAAGEKAAAQLLRERGII